MRPCATCGFVRRPQEEGGNKNCCYECEHSAGKEHSPMCQMERASQPKPRVFPALARQAERERLRKAADEYDAQAQALEEESSLKDARVKRKQASDCRLKIRLMR